MKKAGRKGKNPDKSRENPAYCSGMYIDKKGKSFYNFFITSGDLHKKVYTGDRPAV